MPVAEIESADGLAADARDAVRDLILVLADSKRLLGMRYANWTLGAPELEAGIACASMAQDEWGHARQLYALLKGFDEDPTPLEHEREPGEYRSMEALDREPEGWPGLVVLNAVADTALSVQFDAMRECAYMPVRQRCEKLLEEERFHAAHGAAWFRRLARSGEDARNALRNALDEVLPGVFRWFGPESERAEALRASAIVDGTPGELRCRLAGRVGPLLEAVDASELAEDAPEFDGFDEARRRGAGAGPDEATIAMVRGDKNRAFLLD